MPGMPRCKESATEGTEMHRVSDNFAGSTEAEVFDGIRHLRQTSLASGNQEVMEMHLETQTT